MPKKIFICALLIAAGSFILPKNCLAAFVEPETRFRSFEAEFLLQLASQSIVINEIAWMGTENSSNDEWIELYNNSEADIDLTGWVLEAADETPSISLEGTITAGGYFLLERTDDSSVTGIAADQIYVGALEN